ncbi:hypothetical protein [Haloterrigena alkaliphila]|uniref:Transcriptional regulator n=1 Tax=Haloterrigena alkaliphila TaxID=2816475 RepID=A0A8A2VJX7_9EURY|nr:hypothetical protein [Haloterrigena alkaliphila]QSW98508.1 hypothetical protein J0X25_14040 [Haloterrigena alkaliphila]
MVQQTEEMFDALADQKRRTLLFALLETTPQTDSPITHDSPPDTGRAEYQHCDLPKLDDYGFIEWTPAVNTVERGPRFDEIAPLLELLDAHHEHVFRVK